MAVGRALVSCGVLTHVKRKQHFEDEEIFYRMDQDRWNLVRDRCVGVGKGDWILRQVIFSCPLQVSVHLQRYHIIHGRHA